MNFLADESCPGPVIRALCKAGHDVIAIAEVTPGATDQQVLDRALSEKRVLITEDRDSTCPLPKKELDGGGHISHHRLAPLSRANS